MKLILIKNYALHLGIRDEQYEAEGAKIISDEQEIINNSNAILQLNIINNSNLDKLKEDQVLIGVLNPFSNKEKLNKVSSKK